MLPSLYSGVSGLKNHNTRMNVVGNNIANVNTYGFKYERVNFQDILSQTLAGAASPTGDKGGVNPKQMGLGMSIASIDKIFSQGSLQNTGKNTDLAITGDGFFVVSKGDQEFFTRAGVFDIDENGTLVNPNGMKVQGWMAQELAGGQARIDTSASLEDITIPIYGKLPARATTNVRYRSNLESTSPIIGAGATPEQILSAGVSTSIDLFDSEGEVHPLKLIFWRTGVNTWMASAAVSMVSAGVTINIPATVDMIPGAGAPAGATSQMTLNFSPQGALLSAGDMTGAPAQNVGTANANVRFQVPGRNPSTVVLNLGDFGMYNGVTQFASPSTTKAVMQDGYGMGYLESFIIDDRGVVTGSYSNGQKKPLAQVATAVFTNPGGLTKQGENLFSVTNNSGIANVGEADTGGRGKILAGTLEMSNVDLAEQFTDMIVTQRGFQANSRTITTADQMLQELLALKR